MVTATPRGGTTYAARMFTAAGLDCAHEHALRNPGPNFDIPHITVVPTLGESSWLGGPWAARLKRFHDVQVICHQTRHPQAAIGSMLTHRWICNDGLAQTAIARYFVPEAFTEPTEIRRIARFWVSWNRLCAEHADVTWQVERLDIDDVAVVADMVGHPIERTRLVIERMWAIPTDANGSKGRTAQVSASDLGATLVDDIETMAADYGYTLDWVADLKPPRWH